MDDGPPKVGDLVADTWGIMLVTKVAELDREHWQSWNVRCYGLYQHWQGSRRMKNPRPVMMSIWIHDLRLVDGSIEIFRRTERANDHRSMV